MKLYEVQARPILANGIKSKDDPQPCDSATWYCTSKGEAIKLFNTAKKDLKTLNQAGRVQLNLVHVITDIKAADWCRLLEADAPGMACELTPRDLIEKRTWLLYGHHPADHPDVRGFHRAGGEP